MSGLRPSRLEDLLSASVQQHGDRLAVESPELRLSYAELAEEAAACADRIAAAGCRPGEAVLLAVDNDSRDVAGQFAAWRTRAVAVPVPRSASASTVRSTAERTGARLLLGRRLPAPWHDLVEDDGPAADVRTLRRPGRGRPSELGADQALVVFTSGSTGRPKGVVLSHRGFARKLDAIQRLLPFAPGTAMWQALQLNFSFGQWTSLLTLASGGTLRLRPKFSVSGLLRALAEGEADRVAVVPSMLRMVLSRLDRADGEDVLAGIGAAAAPKLWIAGGEPLPAAVGRAVRERFPHAGVADVYGLSESSTSDLILTPDRYDREAGTIGRPTSGVEVRVVGPRGDDRPRGEAGELWVRTEHLMTGYLGDPEATAAAVTGGWLRTGDLARYRSGDGLLELTGRAKHLIVRGGNKISPVEVENVFNAHPDCGACVAVGRPDAVLGERVALLMVPRAGREVDPLQVLSWAGERMDRHQLPDTVHLIEGLPLGRTGKVDRERSRALAARLGAGRPAEAGHG